MRIPSDGDYRNYDGAHCFCLWKQLSDDWQCPGCGRTKRQIMRWTLRTPNGRRFWGWMAGLHTHHDHSQGFVETGRGRFHKIIICDQCNSADGLAKRKLRLPSNFSFSAGEIRSISAVCNINTAWQARNRHRKSKADIQGIKSPNLPLQLTEGSSILSIFSG